MRTIAMAAIASALTLPAVAGCGDDGAANARTTEGDASQGTDDGDDGDPLPTSAAGSTTDTTTGTTAGTTDGDGGSTGDPCPVGTQGCPCDIGVSCDASLQCDGGTCQPIPPRCGDGNVDPAEACDDGNASDTDECTTACELARCGDGFVGPDEACDDGNADDGDNCPTTCEVQRCGDGFVGPAEACDDGNTVDDDGCTNACALPTCGDGIVQAPEVCDDGDNDDRDACLTTCVAASCGDGFTWTGVEQCDDGDNLDTNACTNACLDAMCGDGIVFAGVEDCDDANSSNADACLNGCIDARCGDGFVWVAMEQCDDGNNTQGDGCNNDCVTSGSVIWTRTFNSASNSADAGLAVASDSVGNAIVTGYVTVSGQGFNIWTRKYSAAGATMWTRTVNGGGNLNDTARGVAIGANDRVFIAGGIRRVGNNLDSFIGGYTAGGVTNFNGAVDVVAGNSDFFTDIAVDGQGRLVVSRFGPAAYAARINLANGSTLVSGELTLNGAWGRGIATRGEDVFLASDFVTSGGDRAVRGFIFDWTGNVSDPSPVPFGFDAAGNDEIADVDVNATHIVTVGSFEGPGNLFDIWVTKHPPQGAPDYSHVYDGGSQDLGRRVVVDAEGNAVVVGQTTVTGQSSNVFVRKLDPSGNVLWTRTHNGPANGADAGWGVALDPAGNIFVSGTETVSGQSTNVWLRKYAP